MTEDEVRVRTAVADDLPAMADLWLELMDFHEKRDAALALDDGAEAHWTKWAAGKIDDEKSVVAVSESAGAVIGYCIATIKERSIVFKRRRYGEIMELAVTAERRSGGVGTMLYEFTIERLKARGVDWVWLEVASANEVGGAFWEKHGFKRFLETRQRDI